MIQELIDKYQKQENNLRIQFEATIDTDDRSDIMIIVGDISGFLFDLKILQKEQDEFAKGFAEWCGRAYFFDGEKWSNYTERYTTSELLQKYKDSL